jgi:hypothetical protein
MKRTKGTEVLRREVELKFKEIGPVEQSCI